MTAANMRLLLVLPSVFASSSSIGALHPSNKVLNRRLADVEDQHVCFDNRCHDDPEYRSSFGTTCTDHLGLLPPTKTCFNDWLDTNRKIRINEHVTVEANEQALMELMLACPCACNMDCGATHAPTISLAPSVTASSNPIAVPTSIPSSTPSFYPTLLPTAHHTSSPSVSPSSVAPTSASPSASPTNAALIFDPEDVGARTIDIKDQMESTTADDDGGPWYQIFLDLSTRTIIIISVFAFIALSAILYSGVLVRRLKRASREGNADDDLSMSTIRDMQPRRSRSIRPSRSAQFTDPKNLSMPIPVSIPARHHSHRAVSNSMNASDFADLVAVPHLQQVPKWSSAKSSRGARSPRSAKSTQGARSFRSLNVAPKPASVRGGQNFIPYIPQRMRSRSDDYCERRSGRDSYVDNNISFSGGSDEDHNCSTPSFSDDDLDDTIADFLEFSKWQKEKKEAGFNIGDRGDILLDNIASAASAGQKLGKSIANEVQEVLTPTKKDALTPSSQKSVFTWFGNSVNQRSNQRYGQQDYPEDLDVENGIPPAVVTVPTMKEVGKEEEEEQEERGGRVKRVIRLW